MTTQGFHRLVETAAGSDGCWPWTGSRNRWGYGRVKIDGVEMNASRAAFIAANGSLSSDLLVLHSCDNPPCCNPAHLRAGSQLENMADRRERGGYPVGSDSPLALQLPPDLLAAVRTAYAPGVKGCGTPALAARFGLSRSTVQRIVTRSDRWRECHPRAKEAS